MAELNIPPDRSANPTSGNCRLSSTLVRIGIHPSKYPKTHRILLQGIALISVHICVCTTCVQYSQRSEQAVGSPCSLLELQEGVNCLIWTVGNKLRSPARAAGSLTSEPSLPPRRHCLTGKWDRGWKSALETSCASLQIEPPPADPTLLEYLIRRNSVLTPTQNPLPGGFSLGSVPGIQPRSLCLTHTNSATVIISWN